ncbi:RNA-directed RNA polymerase [Phomopsis vexans RNA virus]|uniref:RNA-directed RNA polymerase n=1 Tax=Phomopsis vexans RNA virus TaxID=1580605 RepID=A0A0A7RS29_9VIRU|nr:RNA-directed RNA polymerase [Phomopsis vexans RNA virus]AJA41109.1 RNA-directed RNA polymerase [Phomopsis vexans RNA virus]
MPFAQQISFVYRPRWNNTVPSRLARSAASFLHCFVPVQVPLEQGDLDLLTGQLCGHLTMPPDAGFSSMVVDRDEAMAAFPPKNYAMAIEKANIYVDEIARDMYKHTPTELLRAGPYLRRLRDKGVTHDQAAGFLLYAATLSRWCPHAYEWAYYAITDPAAAKEVSDYLKAVGANSSSYGALLVETDTLQGRGVPGTDLPSDSAKRCNLAALKEDMLAELDPVALRSAVRRVLRHELRHRDGNYALDFPTLEEHWSSRWSWAVNGSHSSMVSKTVPMVGVRGKHVHKYHRRAWLESVRDDPRPNWEGKTFVSCNPKLECGKTRAIYACDTVSYLAFEHLMAPVERAWQGRRILLNPGKGGSIGLAERVKRCRDRSGVSMMLDYTDFNSHHTTSAQQILIEETCALTGYPPDLTAKLVRSFELQDIYLSGKRVGRSAGTLMSGHRCTTYINSVLNMAYLMVVLGEDFVLERQSLHVGDDVYLGARDYPDAGHIITEVMRSPLRMNKSKQSVGHVGTELTRVASNKRDSFGYLARATANLIAGNWYSDSVMDPLEGFTTMLAGCRTLANRGHGMKAPLLLESAVKRILGDDCPDDALLRRILLGDIAVNSGPQYSSSGRHVSIQVKAEFTTADDFGYSLVPKLATTTYLSSHASPLEIRTLTECGIDPSPSMVRSSWKKSLRIKDRCLERLVFGAVTTRPARGSIRAEDLLKQPKPHGCLLQFPLLVLAKDRIPDSELRRAVSDSGGRGWVEDIKLEAWGEYHPSMIVNTGMSFSDAAALSKRTDISVMTSTRRCYV